MRPAFTLSALGAALLLATSPAQSIGFGRVANGTQLGQRLNFSATVQLAPNEILPHECVAAEVSSGENKLQPGQVRVALEGPNGSRDRSVRVTSTSIIEEPVVTVRVTLGCTSKVSRTFVTFVDPPLIYAAHAGPEAPSAEPPAQRSDSQVAPLLASVDRTSKKTSARSRVALATTLGPSLAGASSSPSQLSQSLSPQHGRLADAPLQGAAQPAPPQRAERMAAALAAARTVARTTTRTVSAPLADRRFAGSAAPQRAKPARAPATSGPRLKLDAAPTVLAVATPTPVLAAAPASSVSVDPIASAATTASVSAVDGLTAQLAIERGRVHGLEQNQARLDSESKAVQGTLLAMQARLKAAEAGRDSSGLVDLLAWLVGGLTLAVGVLTWQQMRARRAVAWWQQAESASRLALESALPAPADEAASAITSEPTATELVALEAAAQQPAAKPAMYPTDDMTRPAPFVMSAPRSIFESSRGVGLSLSTPSTPSTVDDPTLRAAPPVRELSVEELIDLEQQADFFAVLGQDDAAIDLLMSHVDGAEGLSPLPYLKLLEIHRRLGNVPAYQDIRDRFNDRFNARAPDWDTDLQMGRGLADYPTTMAQLASLWKSPSRAMQILDASVFRRDGQKETFELPAYRELLLLYSVARDLAETDDVGNPDRGVDLLLPLDPLDPFGAPPITRLVATEPLADARIGDPATAPFDLDVTFEPVESATTRIPPLPRNRPLNQCFSSDTQYPEFDFDDDGSRGVVASGFHVGGR